MHKKVCVYIVVNQKQTKANKVTCTRTTFSPSETIICIISYLLSGARWCNDVYTRLPLSSHCFAF